MKRLPEKVKETGSIGDITHRLYKNKTFQMTIWKLCMRVSRDIDLASWKRIASFKKLFTAYTHWWSVSQSLGNDTFGIAIWLIEFALDRSYITSRSGRHVELFCSVSYEVTCQKNRWGCRYIHMSTSNTPKVSIEARFHLLNHQNCPNVSLNLKWKCQ